MRILYICDEDISKPTCGCAVRSKFLYDALCTLGEVTVLKPSSLGQSSWLYRLFDTPFLKLTKVAHWPFGRSPIAADRYDAVVCRYLLNASRVRAWKIAPCYVDVDDLPTQAFESVEGKRLPKWLRPVGGWLVRLCQSYCLRQCKGAWAVTPEQKEIVGCFTACGLLPNLATMPGAGYRADGPCKRQLMTVGLMGYEPNCSGVDWFVRTVWPAVRAKWPGLSYMIAGKGAPAGLAARWNATPGVRYLGFVDDLDALYAESLAVVSPIMSGAGTCIKVVEAGVHGRVTFATPTAARGLDAMLAFGGIRLFDDADGFARQFEEFLAEDRRTRDAQILVKTQGINGFSRFADIVRSVLCACEDKE